MVGNRMCALALTAVAIICLVTPALTAQFDGNWNMVAVTTSGHCGSIPIGLGITLRPAIPFPHPGPSVQPNPL
jgi:hypothetical protein